MTPERVIVPALPNKPPDALRRRRAALRGRETSPADGTHNRSTSAAAADGTHSRPRCFPAAACRALRETLPERGHCNAALA